MATYTASQAKTITMVATTVDTVTLTGTGKFIRFIQSAGKTHVYYTVEQPGGTPATPTVGGDNCYITIDTAIHDHPWSGNGCVLKLITAGTPTLTIQLLG